MTDSMVERVSAVLKSLPIRDMDGVGCELDNLRLREAARAAIEVMREPTQKMTDAVLLGDLDSWVIDDNWRAMIDAALAEPATK